MATLEKSQSETANQLKPYHSPNIVDYGQMSELTQTLAGPGGDDGGDTPSSYSQSPS